MKIKNDIACSGRRLRGKLAMPVSLVLFLVLSACHPNGVKSGEAIVQVGDNVLTAEDLLENNKFGNSPEDSILMTEHYIKLWVNNQLLYEVARKNTTREAEMEINQLVENYKKSLTIYHYQEQLVSEKVDKEISDAELEKFYAAHQDMFKSLLPEDSTTSFEYIKPTIREMVINRKKIEFLKKVENDLYDRAVKSGTVVFYK